MLTETTGMPSVSGRSHCRSLHRCQERTKTSSSEQLQVNQSSSLKSSRLLLHHPKRPKQLKVTLSWVTTWHHKQGSAFCSSNNERAEPYWFPLALSGDSPAVMDGPQKGDHVSAPRDKPGVSLGSREDATSRAPSLPPPQRFITAAVWNYGSLHLVMKSPRSWQQKQHTCTHQR